MTSRPLAVPLDPIPPRIAALIRPELPSLNQEILREICHAIPEYSRIAHSEHAAAIDGLIEHSLRAFADRIDDPSASTHLRDEMCRGLGRLQVQFDAGLTHLDCAFRIGVRVAWRRAVLVTRRHDVPTSIQSSLADLLFGYVDDLAALAREGYLEAKNQADGRWTARRRRLARDLLDGRAGQAAIAHAAREARWPLPEQLTVVVVEPLAPVDEAALPTDVLVGRNRNRTVLLVPGSPDRGEIAALRVALGGAPVVVGPAVPLAATHHAVRWATRASTLADDGGVADDDGTTCVDDHLLTLWLASDSALARHILARRLAALDAMTPTQRARLTDTLYWWLVHNGNACRMADELGIHPQTVRYRMRALETALGDVLDDPEWRISCELALRALRVRQARSPGQRRSQVG